MRWVGLVAHTGVEKLNRILVRKLEGKEQPGRWA
jgi:hypothetical protein